MTSLYIVNNPENLAKCLSLIEATDGILLLEDGVYAARQPSKIKHNQLYVLSEDLTARGLQNIHTDWQSIDYSEFVQKTLDFDKSVSWL